MARISIPGYVTEHLLAGEEIIARVSAASAGFADATDYYATNKRVLRFDRVEWGLRAFLFGLVGLLLSSLLQRGPDLGAIEYSRISRITRKEYHLKVLVILGLVLGLPAVVFGIIVNTKPEAAGGGWILIIAGLLIMGALCAIKHISWQFEIDVLSQRELRKWRLVCTSFGGKKREVEKFVEVVEERVGREAG